MKKVEVEVSDIALSGSSSGAYAMVLSEVEGNRKLPIVIGGAEAQAIARPVLEFLICLWMHRRPKNLACQQSPAGTLYDLVLGILWH